MLSLLCQPHMSPNPSRRRPQPPRPQENAPAVARSPPATLPAPQCTLESLPDGHGCGDGGWLLGGAALNKRPLRSPVGLELVRQKPGLASAVGALWWG